MGVKFIALHPKFCSLYFYVAYNFILLYLTINYHNLTDYNNQIALIDYALTSFT